MKRNGNHTTPIHPGLVLRDELEELAMSQSALAEYVGVLPKTINEICRGKRGISVEMACIRLPSCPRRGGGVSLTGWWEVLGASPNFWLNLQNNWELSTFDYDVVYEIVKS